MEQEFYKFRVKWCPVCDQGWVNIAKEVVTQKMFVFCDECEAEWESPEKITTDTETRFSYGRRAIPTLAEIREMQWEQYLLEKE